MLKYLTEQYIIYVVKRIDMRFHSRMDIVITYIIFACGQRFLINEKDTRIHHERQILRYMQRVVWIPCTRRIILRLIYNVENNGISNARFVLP